MSLGAWWPAWPSSPPASPSMTCRTSSIGAGGVTCRPLAALSVGRGMGAGDGVTSLAGTRSGGRSVLLTTPPQSSRGRAWFWSELGQTGECGRAPLGGLTLTTATGPRGARTRPPAYHLARLRGTYANTHGLVTTAGAHSATRRSACSSRQRSAAHSSPVASGRASVSVTGASLRQCEPGACISNLQPSSSTSNARGSAVCCG